MPRLLTVLKDMSRRKMSPLQISTTVWFISKRAAPIIGTGSIERVDDNIKALDIELTEENSKCLEELYKPKTSSSSESTPFL